MPNIQGISDSLLCSACGACKAICGKNAIDFNFTNIGRLKAEINENCIDCGLCTKVCPSLNKTEIQQEAINPLIGKVIHTYIGRATDQHIYKNAQSGGICTAITTYLLETNKVDVVVTCKMCKDLSPYPLAQLIRNKKDLISCQRSCYTPVDLRSALKNIKPRERIAIVGLPCQIAGATLLQQKSTKYSNILYKIGLICDRNHCKGYQDTILSYLPKTREKKNLIYRKKDFCYKKNDFCYKKHQQAYYPYRTAPVVVELDNGRSYIFPNGFRFALKDFFTAPRCRVCLDKLNINADIVLGDPWGMSDVDWDHGDSLAISRTEKGVALLNEVSKANYIDIRESDFQEVVKGQSIQSRPQQVRKYIQALSKHKNLPHTNSYLFEMCSDIQISETETQSAYKEIMSFQEMENYSYEKIIKKAQMIIAQSTGIWHPSLCLYRINAKMRNIIWTIRKRFII